MEQIPKILFLRRMYRTLHYTFSRVLNSLFSFFVRCKICHVAFLFTSDNLRNHVRSAHQLPVNDYRDMYLVQGSGQALPPPPDQGGIEAKTMSDDPDKMCVSICQLCGLLTKVLRMHTRRQHKMSISDYRKIWPTAQYSQETYHRWASFHQCFGSVYI